MKPISPVIVGLEEHEIKIGENQPEYIPVPALAIDKPSIPIVTRWRLSPEERGMVSVGADIVLQQLTFGEPFQPVNLQVVFWDQQPEVIG